MLRAILPPFCLLIALAMAITGFSMLAFGAPEAGVSLHEARASGDEQAESTLEADLASRKNQRVTMITLLLVGSGVMTVVAFGSMKA